MTNKWFLVVLAGLFEVGWVSGLKYADSFLEWVLTIIGLAASFWALIYCSSKLPSTTVYAVFVGIGSAGAVILEMAMFGEPVSLIKIALIAVLVIGIIGLKIVTAEKDEKDEKDVSVS